MTEMTETNCENVRIASMARADGYKPLLSPAQVEAHIATCVDCRQEVEEMGTLIAVLDSAKRRARYEQVWPLIEPHLGEAAPARNGRFDWRLFLVLGFLLAGYRLILMVNGQEFGLWFKLVPVALVIAVFGYVKENPFKINSDLRLKGLAS